MLEEVSSGCFSICRMSLQGGEKYNDFMDWAKVLRSRLAGLVGRRSHEDLASAEELACHLTLLGNSFLEESLRLYTKQEEQPVNSTSQKNRKCCIEKGYVFILDQGPR